MKQYIERKMSGWNILLLFIPLVPLALLLLYYYFEDKHERELLQEKGIYTECVVIAYGEGRIGVRGPKKGFFNKCQYSIGNSIHYCYIFTTVKPLPFNEKIELKYFQFDDGRVTITFPDSVNEKYREYGFNDYGH